MWFHGKEEVHKAELQEQLNRQEALLRNKRFIDTLPDQGKKIAESVEKVRKALEELEEEEKKRARVSAVGAEFQAKYQKAFARRRNVDTKTLDPLKERENALEETSTKVDCQRDTEAPDAKTTKTTKASSASASADRTKDTDLVEAFERVTLSEDATSPIKDTDTNSPPRNPLSAPQFHKTPHYVEVLEKSDKKTKKPKFKLNRLPESDSLLPATSSGSATPLSAEARRQRDKKHLDDITAAKLPPLHHSPAQLLPLEESISLLQEQIRKQQELQAKFAAQKLAEGLSVGMSSYNPESAALGAYREVRDEGDLSDVD